jgi:hypothetical protein
VPARKSTSCAAYCAGTSGSERSSPPATSTYPDCSLASAAYPGIDVSLAEGIAADMFRRDRRTRCRVLSLAGEVPEEFAIEQLSEEEAVAAS